MNISCSKKVAQIMSGAPVTVDVNSPLSDAAEKMELKIISSLLVEENNQVIGIITERDVMRALGQSMAQDVTVGSLMTRGLITVKDTDEVHAAFHQMAVNNIRHLVVVNEANKPVGVLSETDFRKFRDSEDFNGVATVAQAMSQSYLAAKGSVTVADAAREMQSRKLSCAIVAKDGKPHGIVSERDMVRLFHQQRNNATLSEVMTSPVTSVTDTVNLESAVKLMRDCRIRRLVVTDGTGQIVGVLNEHDVLRHMEDGYVQMLQELVIKQAQELNNNLFAAVINNLPDQILVKDKNSRYVSCNQSFAKKLGMATEELVGKCDYDFFPKELSDNYRRLDLQVMDTETPVSLEEPFQLDGVKSWLHTTKAPMRDAAGNVTGVVIYVKDITRDKQEHRDLQRRSWALRALSNCNKALVISRTESAMLQGICEAVVADSDLYLLAWVGWAEHDEKKSVRVAASAGGAVGYLESIQVSWSDEAIGSGPTGMAIRDGRTVINKDPKRNPKFSPWLKKALSLGIRASIAVPILVEGKIVGSLMVYASDEEAFDGEEVKLFENLMNDLGHGLAALAIQRKFDRSLIEKEMQAQKLDAALEGALLAVASTLEQRDPYTAGHQKHVAELAVKIGREMGMSSEQLRALHLAGIVHDLGKIQIPTEILTKSGRLTPAEFSLIKIHPEVGYEILRHINFPWPIADIIHQHHESLDGSGYPLGLTAEQILPEAKILTVADIVESMSSDRPYRAALGLETAMNEISKLSGSKLDPAVVNACVTILKRGEYSPSAGAQF